MIARYGYGVARLVRVAPPAPRRRPGTWRESLRIAEDFDDGMSEDGR